MSACPMKKTVDGHFAATITPGDERKMRDHLDGCETCRAHYRRRALFEKLDPEAPNAEARIAVGLGLGIARRAPVMRLVPPVAFAMLAAAAVLFFLRSPANDGFTARGGGIDEASVADAGSSSRVHVYRVPPGGRAQPVIDTIGRDDELAFAYENGAKKQHLLVFAVDERGEVYWFHPAWTDAAADPTALAIAVDPGVRELGEAVRHPFRGEKLTIHAVFLDKPVSVRQIEAMLRGGTIDIPGAVDDVHGVRVAP